ncbi:MAG TPA: ketopantoate reductase family protein [Gemmatimonadaceae bacterium]|nr:ketopantoate reductase family protein [Gemmatimonadaceae bacterium]
MRILVVGAGAIGGYFGARLLEGGSDVTFLLRPRRAEEIRTHGLVIRSPHGDVAFPAPPVVLADRLTSPFDLILVACKAYDLTEVMDTIGPAVGPRTSILPVLNGMRHLDELGARFGAHAVLGGHCMISVALGAQGAITHYGDLHVLTFGELDGSQSPRVAEIARECARAKFTINASTELLQEMWEKWVFIAALAGINSLLRASVGEIVRAGAADLAMALYEECCAVGRTNGFPSRPPALERARSILTNAELPITASLFKDVEAWRRTESEHIVRDLIARGGADVGERSLLRLAYAHLKAYEIRRASRPAAHA